MSFQSTLWEKKVPNTQPRGGEQVKLIRVSCLLKYFGCFLKSNFSWGGAGRGILEYSTVQLAQRGALFAKLWLREFLTEDASEASFRAFGASHFFFFLNDKLRYGILFFFGVANKNRCDS